jgi:hypothetical protein
MYLSIFFGIELSWLSDSILMTIFSCEKKITNLSVIKLSLSPINSLFYVSGGGGGNSCSAALPASLASLAWPSLLWPFAGKKRCFFSSGSPRAVPDAASKPPLSIKQKKRPRWDLCFVWWRRRDTCTKRHVVCRPWRETLIFFNPGLAIHGQSFAGKKRCFFFRPAHPASRGFIANPLDKKNRPNRPILFYLVEAAGIEPASANPLPSALHA